VTRRFGALLAGLCCATAIAAVDTPEAATGRSFARIRTNPARLWPFLREMPKGGDLHNHLSGAVYAESYLRWAAEDGLCLATASMTIVGGTCDATADRPAVSAVLQNATLYSQAIDAMSMRHRNPASNGHDHFFASFARFNLPSNSRTGDMLAEVASRAAAEHVSYLELMITPDGGMASRLGRAAGWDADLGRQRDKLLAAGFRDAVVGEVRKLLDAAEARRNELLACGTPKADPGCLVTIRYISQVARAGPPEAVFAQILGGFEAATADPRVVSFNLVQPEDHPTAVRDFSLHMSIIDFLHAQYPRVPIALHAAELAPGMVAPEAMRFHVRDSMRRGHARRIGHATGIMHEDAALDLLREMATQKVLVEVALSSADQILGVKGDRHPLRTLLAFGVPVAIVTDDMGVSRSTHTQEFMKAVDEQGLDYKTLKALVRNSIEYAFADPATKTRLKTDLEKAFRVFEAGVSKAARPRTAPE
jgi:adenosine deaminase